MATPPDTRAAAILTIRDAADMTPAGRDAIVKWLRRQAHQFMAHADQYAGRYTARYLYRVAARQAVRRKAITP